LGEGALLDPEDPNYDPSDELRGLPCFIGKYLDPDTGYEVVGDYVELSVLSESVTIGRPQERWIIRFVNLDGTIVKASLLPAVQDRTLGVIRMVGKILKDEGDGRYIDRNGEGGV
jgi:hypothetical protein